MMKMNYSQPANKNRQMLICDDYKTWPKENNPIKTPADLRDSLQTAIKIELATIPPYLCALYSIREGTNRVATGIIRSVVMEEMLHLVLAANLLNAVGGKPVIDPTTMLDYPGSLPLGDPFPIGLLRFSPEAIQTFLKIEKPERPYPPSPGSKPDSIGQFYTLILQALEILSGDGQKLFTGDEKKQITDEHYYGSGGKLVAVTNLKSAEIAIKEIIGQGEGIDGTINDNIPGDFGDQVELAHYFRFNEIAEGRRYREHDKTQQPPSGAPIDVDWGAVYNMKANPKLADYADSPELYAMALDFNQTYASLLSTIQAACNGDPGLLAKNAIPLMYNLKYKAVELMKIPLGDSLLTAGPTFEPVNIKK